MTLVFIYFFVYASILYAGRHCVSAKSILDTKALQSEELENITTKNGDHDILEFEEMLKRIIAKKKAKEELIRLLQSIRDGRKLLNSVKREMTIPRWYYLQRLSKQNTAKKSPLISYHKRQLVFPKYAKDDMVNRDEVFNKYGNLDYLMENEQQNTRFQEKKSKQYIQLNNKNIREQASKKIDYQEKSPNMIKKAVSKKILQMFLNILRRIRSKLDPIAKKSRQFNVKTNEEHGIFSLCNDPGKECQDVLQMIEEIVRSYNGDIDVTNTDNNLNGVHPDHYI